MGRVWVVLTEKIITIQQAPGNDLKTGCAVKVKQPKTLLCKVESLQVTVLNFNHKLNVHKYIDFDIQAHMKYLS